MALTITALAAEVRESNQRLSKAVESLNIEVANINVYLAFIRRSIFILVPIMLTLLLGGIGASYKIVWDTARLHASVETLQRDIGMLKQDVGVVKETTGRIEQKLTSQEAALARIEKAVVQ